MTTRWVKGDEHLVLVVEGESTKVGVLKSALEIDLEANIIIDISAMDKVDNASIKFLNDFSDRHKAKNFSILAVTKQKFPNLTQMEIVPTIPEARDLVFMEITERELGFFGEEEK